MKTVIAALIGSALIAGAVTPASADFSFKFGRGHDFRGHDRKVFFRHDFGFNKRFFFRHNDDRCDFRKIRVFDGHGWTWKFSRSC